MKLIVNFLVLFLYGCYKEKTNFSDNLILMIVIENK